VTHFARGGGESKPGLKQRGRGVFSPNKGNKKKKKKPPKKKKKKKNPKEKEGGKAAAASPRTLGKGKKRRMIRTHS